MTARSLLLSFGVCALVIFSGCGISLSEEAQQKLDQAKTEVREKAEDAQKEVKEAKEKVEQKVQEVNKAVDAVNTALGNDDETKEGAE